MIEETLVFIKPGAVRRKLVGEIINRFEHKGFDITAMRMLTLDDEMVHKHYGEHENTDYFEPLKKFIMSGPVVALVLRGRGAVNEVRKIVGATDPQMADPGTIRGDYGLVKRHNVVHAADGHENAAREIKIFFPDYQK